VTELTGEVTVGFVCLICSLLFLQKKQIHCINQKSTPTGSPQTSSTHTLKYIENFDNPYVKLVIVCKMCNKEASKFQRNWKTHYMTHLGNDDKPHKCSVCNHGFVMPNALRKHMEKVHGILGQSNAAKKEEFPQMKIENPYF